MRSRRHVQERFEDVFPRANGEGVAAPIPGPCGVLSAPAGESESKPEQLYRR